MGTRCICGGEDAGDIPKNRLSRSLNGSGPPKEPKEDMVMVTVQ